MNIINNLIILVLMFGISSCKDKKANEIPINISTDLSLDHVNIWVENPKKAKKILSNIGLTSVPDSLSQIHEGQGTAGRYFRFLNGYLELIFINDQNEFEKNNKKNSSLDFEERANHEKNGGSPFSIALKVKDYDVSKIPFEKVSYHQEWMVENVNIYAARNSKTILNEPSIFVVYPEIESDQFESLSDLKNIPDEYSIWREFYKHPNGAEKITSLMITSTDLNSDTKTIKALNEIENLTVKNGRDHLMELHFDNDIQGKTFDLRPELPLIIYL